MLSIFSWACWPFVYLRWKNFYSFLCPFFFFLLSSHCVHSFFSSVQLVYLCLLLWTLFQVDCLTMFCFSSFSEVLSCFFNWNIFLCLLILPDSLFISMYWVYQLSLPVLKEWPYLGDVLWGSEVQCHLATRARCSTHMWAVYTLLLLPGGAGGQAWLLDLLCGPEAAAVGCWWAWLLLGWLWGLAKTQGWVGLSLGHAHWCFQVRWRILKWCLPVLILAR